MSYGATPQIRFHPQKFPVEKFKVHEVSVGEALQVHSYTQFQYL